MAELYLWEISKLAFKEEPPDKLGSKFLAFKFKYFETNSTSGKVSDEEGEQADEYGNAPDSNE